MLYFLQEPEQDEERSPSPISGVSSPTLDMNTFQESDNEPVTAWNNILTPVISQLISIYIYCYFGEYILINKIPKYDL